MRFPSLAFAAVAGLWQQPLAPEDETITSTRHVHVSRTSTNTGSTIYAVLMGTSTPYMDHLPATLMTKSIPWQALQTANLECRSEGESASTMRIKVTQTVNQVQATVFASKVGTSVSTPTDVPQSLREEAAEDAEELSSSQLAAAISSAKSAALAHSTVAVLATTTSSDADASPAVAEGQPQYTNTSSSTQPSITTSESSSVLPIGLELRSNGGAATTSSPPTTTTARVPGVVIAVIYGTSTSMMTSIPPTLLAEITATQPTTTAQSSSSEGTTEVDSLTSTTISDGNLQFTDANAAGFKSTQTALIQATTHSDEDAAKSTTAVASTSQRDSSSSTFSSASTSMSVNSASVTSNKIYTIPMTTRSTTSPSFTPEFSTPTTPSATSADTFFTAYNSQSSASSTADIAADNAAGASGGDSGSFKLSKGGFAAIISVVSIGVGLGLVFLILFVVARRRQWKVRQSIARASRRFTGRFSSHPNKKALSNEKGNEPTLPIIEPRQPAGPRPAPSSRRPQQGFANIDATLHSNYRGVESVVRISRGPEAWRKAMAGQRVPQSQSQRRKPELRVDTGLAGGKMEEGNMGEQGRKKRADWRDLFRAL
ncbi:hypothetical protein E4T42_09195 [Aureobasidium subglaciale]|nr:hypothetical protein E4T42_09195 [Aureobasidium subglaciale]